MTSQREIRVLNTPQDLFQAAAGEIVVLVSDAVRRRGRFCVALSGGSTPKSVYALLANTPSLPWDKMYFFFGDERNVPPDHPDSNYRMAYEAASQTVSCCGWWISPRQAGCHPQPKHSGASDRTGVGTSRVFSCKLFHLDSGLEMPDNLCVWP